MTRFALGVDIGGTKISLTLGNSRGKILAKEVVPTFTGRKALQGIEAIASVLEKQKKEFLGRGRIRGIGVGIPGPMDPERGVVQRSPHLSGWQNFPLKSFLERRLKLPVFITNDANAAAVGEQVFGTGRRVRDFVYLTISTGIGGGIILDGKLLVGASFGAGEVGHTIIVSDGERCGCGRRGCLEAYASGTAIANYMKSQIRLGRKSKLSLTPNPLPRRGRGKGEGVELNAETIAQAAKKGDVLSQEAYRRAGHFLGIGLANLINVLNPRMLILGGSVMKSSGLLWPSMIRSARAHAWPSLYAACRIVKTGLRDRVGDLGALALVFARH